jgi:hypothetical protein
MLDLAFDRGRHLLETQKFPLAQKHFEIALSELKEDVSRREGILQTLKEIPAEQHAYEMKIRMAADLDFIDRLSELHSASRLNEAKEGEELKIERFAAVGRKAGGRDRLINRGRKGRLRWKRPFGTIGGRGRGPCPRPEVGNRHQQGSEGNPFYYANLFSSPEVMSSSNA